MAKQTKGDKQKQNKQQSKQQKGDKSKSKDKKAKKYVKPNVKPRMKELYDNVVLPKLMKEFGYRNKLAAPKIQKIIVNMGVGNAHENKKLLETLAKQLALITGQKAVITKARKSIAGFKIREGYPVGCKSTLRKNNMYFFLDKLITLAIPRVKDFRGIKATAFDGRGNFAMGLEEQVVFPEVDASKIEQNEIHGMNITINISGGNNEQSKFLLKEMGMPFKKEETSKKK